MATAKDVSRAPLIVLVQGVFVLVSHDCVVFFPLFLFLPFPSFSFIFPSFFPGVDPHPDMDRYSSVYESIPAPGSEAAAAF